MILVILPIVVGAEGYIKLKIIAWSPISQASLVSNLGKAEYSYFFLMKLFIPILESLYETVVLEGSPEDIELYCKNASIAGEQFILFCFCPPNIAPNLDDIRIIIVLAWEFSTIPIIAWDNEESNDWRSVLSKQGQVITLSSYAEMAIKKALGNSFPVTVVPVPLGRSNIQSRRNPPNPTNKKQITIKGDVFEHSQTNPCNLDYLKHAICSPYNWDKNTHFIEFGDDLSTNVALLNFYQREDWGAWSSSDCCAISLPFSLVGVVQISLLIKGYGNNENKLIDINVGGSSRSIQLTPHPSEHHLTFFIYKPSSIITFGSFDIDSLDNSADQRSMGVGLLSMKIRSPNTLLLKSTSFALETLYAIIRARNKSVGSAKKFTITGTTFTTVLNPTDGRKNINDIITAFAFALGKFNDATLVLKLSHYSMNAFIAEIYEIIRCIGPIKARILIANGYLDDDNYQYLIDATSWYVNASRGEGLCIPLMEFMAHGTPVISPKHTAMSDYITESAALIIKSNLEPTRWPNDPLERITTLYYRINWTSLVNCYLEAYKISNEKSDVYRAMSKASIDTQTEFTCPDKIKQKLQQHIELVAP